MAIETLDPGLTDSFNPAVLLTKLNELIEEYNDLEAAYEQHIHYARELESPTLPPSDTTSEVH